MLNHRTVVRIVIHMSIVVIHRALQEEIDLLQKSNRKLEAELDDKRIDYENFKVCGPLL